MMPAGAVHTPPHPVIAWAWQIGEGRWHFRHGDQLLTATRLPAHYVIARDFDSVATELGAAEASTKPKHSFKLTRQSPVLPVLGFILQLRLPATGAILDASDRAGDLEAALIQPRETL
jgi:hypothetical protein